MSYNPTNSYGEVGIIDYAGRLVTNDNVRYECATGNMYRAGWSVASLAAGASAYLVFDPSLNGTDLTGMYKAKKAIHSTKSPITVEFYEGATLSDNGTEITIYNYNRCDECDPSLNPRAKLYHTPTQDSSGNKYAPDVYVYATTGGLGSSIISAGGTEDDYSAYLNTKYKYLWKFTNSGSETTRLGVSIRFIDEKKYRAGGR